MLVQREQALRRKGQHEQDVGIVAPSSAAQQQHVSSTEVTAPSDLRFDVPTGAHMLPCKQCFQQVLLICTEGEDCVQRHGSELCAVRDQCSGFAGADPSSAELRQKLHERIEVYPTLMAFMKP